jgi:excisionase family DNA binding protein
VKPRRQTERNGSGGELAALRTAVVEAGGRAALDDLYRQMDIEEAALFLGTTKGQLYNLTSRREIPFIPWGRRGVRFRRIDLIGWQEARKRPAAR